ncbi:transposase [Streptomyces noursei]|uniref:transposase n=1 Tax=Streptomyces noursei TaxID=1971 RepID=UPI0033E2146C
MSSPFAKSTFRIDWKARTARCPEGFTSTGWFPVTQRGHNAIVVEFDRWVCRACPSQKRCTTASRGFRTLTLRPQEIHEAVTAARTGQDTEAWRDKYALRAGIEGTVNQALDVTGIRRARYRGLPKVRLQHAFSAAALNLVRLDAYWTDHPLGRNRSSRLERLAYRLIA